MAIVEVGCRVVVRAATATGLVRQEWIISRNATRLQEGVLNVRHPLARLLRHRRVGEVLCPGGRCGVYWLRVEEIHPPGQPGESLVAPVQDAGPADAWGRHGLTDLDGWDLLDDCPF